MLATSLGGCWSFWHDATYNPFFHAVAKGVFFIMVLAIPFMLKDLFEAIIFARRRRRERGIRIIGRGNF